jgi:3-hydroxyisobutyrate dehydrogenase-like beta-hydroxyacid dehydrogenase
MAARTAASSMTTIGFVGIGAMGEPMAANLLKKSFGVTVLKHRREDAANRLREQGANVVTSAAALAGSEAIVLCLPTSREVEATLVAEGGLLDALRPDTIVIDCSTSEPQSTSLLAEEARGRGIGFVAAAMTRGVAGAKQGTLAFFVGGDPAPVERAEAVLGAMGNTFIRFRTAAEAHTAKLISNVLSYSTVALVNEALMMGAKSGVDLTVLHKALMEGAPSKALEAFGPRIIAREYDPARVTIDHACEDMLMQQALAARTNAPTFMHSMAQELYRALNARGLGDRDISMIAELWRSREADNGRP